MGQKRGGPSDSVDCGSLPKPRPQSPPGTCVPRPFCVTPIPLASGMSVREVAPLTPISDTDGAGRRRHDIAGRRPPTIPTPPDMHASRKLCPRIRAQWTGQKRVLMSRPLWSMRDGRFVLGRMGQTAPDLHPIRHKPRFHAAVREAAHHTPHRGHPVGHVRALPHGGMGAGSPPGS